jgi:hypothetical protein
MAAHGSRVTNTVAPARRQVPAAAAASRSARTSACAVGSFVRSRSLCRAATTAPSTTTTAPMGTSSWASAARASSIARCIASWSLIIGRTVGRGAGTGVPFFRARVPEGSARLAAGRQWH